ncbi:MAG TPA: YHS domain-containing (seleno)protein [Chryseosolibacter sp.]|nr:YHS domain-containing (seleno)protein [Chryseosolibacter sp.]
MTKIVRLTGLLIVLATTTFAQAAPEYKHLNLDEDKLALEGYDPVAYFKDGKAVRGKKSMFVKHEGTMYLFSTPANKESFLQSPRSYKPQYGGWCAYAMGAKGEKVQVDPETFKIVGGKLYLFYNRFFNNTLDTWNENEGALITSANENWSRLISH